jgi:hypothetical protein
MLAVNTRRHAISFDSGRQSASVDFMQLQVVADGVVPLPATISVNYDNLRVIPEPSSIALLAAALVLANLRRR